MPDDAHDLLIKEIADLLLQPNEDERNQLKSCDLISKVPDMFIITVAGTLRLHGEDYVRDRHKTGKRCYVQVAKSGDSSTWIIGVDILKRFCLVSKMNPPTISFIGSANALRYHKKP